MNASRRSETRIHYSSVAVNSNIAQPEVDKTRAKNRKIVEKSKTGPKRFFMHHSVVSWYTMMLCLALLILVQEKRIMNYQCWRGCNFFSFLHILRVFFCRTSRSRWWKRSLFDSRPALYLNIHCDLTLHLKGEIVFIGCNLFHSLCYCVSMSTNLNFLLS